MEQLPYLDIHTHRRLHFEGAVTVASLSIEELIQENSLQEFITAGIHPWWPEDYTHEEIEGFKSHVLNLIRQNKLWAIGESGIDRMFDHLDRQKELFLWHLEMAEEHRLPLVIHNVRSGSDFLEIIKAHHPTTPWIFHDFRGNEELMRKILQLHPESYFSFGLSVDNSQAIRELLPHIPLGNLFLETDDQKHLDIHDIYLRAAHRLGIDVDFLKSQIWLNFKKVSSFRPLAN